MTHAITVLPAHYPISCSLDAPLQVTVLILEFTISDSPFEFRSLTKTNCNFLWNLKTRPHFRRQNCKYVCHLKTKNHTIFKYCMELLKMG